MRRTGLFDTLPEAQRVLDEVFRRMPAGRKWQLLASNFRCARQLHEAGVRLRNPGVTPEEIQRSWVEQVAGKGPWLAGVGRTDMDQPGENLDVVREVIEALGRLGIEYAIGGSFASSLHGHNRQTMDADLIVRPFPGREEALAGSFGPAFYASAEAMRQANRDHGCFNIINTHVGFKVDFYVLGDRPFDRSQMARRVRSDLPGGPVEVVSAEDCALKKLEGYRLGGEVSERQWLDVLGVLRTQAGRLDDAYLDRWATELGVSDLLAQARAEAGS